MEHPKWIEVGAVSAALGLGLALFGVEFIPAPSTSADWAAWAQAFGSIAAIGVTAWLAFIPIGAQRRRERRARADFDNMVSDAVDYALLSMDPLATAVSTNNRQAIWNGVHQWKDSGAAETLSELVEIPLAAWPSAIFYTRVHRLAAKLSEFGALMEDLAPIWHAEARAQVQAGRLLAALQARQVEYRQSLAGLTLDD